MYVLQRFSQVDEGLNGLVCYCSSLKLVALVALVSPERARQIEDILLRLAQSGQVRGKVTESQLIELLEQVCARHFHKVITAQSCHLDQAEGGSQSEQKQSKPRISVSFSDGYTR